HPGQTTAPLRWRMQPAYAAPREGGNTPARRSRCDALCTMRSRERTGRAPFHSPAPLQVRELHRGCARSPMARRVQRTPGTHPGDRTVSAPVFHALVFWLPAFLFSTTVHEAAHAWAAWRLGDPTAYLAGQVSLSPWPHVRRSPIGMLVIPLLTSLTQG